MQSNIRVRRDEWSKTDGGGCLMLFGLPFLLAGLFVIGISTGLLPVKGDTPPWFFGIPFGLVFATVGASLILGRSGTTINRRRHRVTKWWGLLVPLSHKDHDLSEYDRVTIDRETRRSSSSKGGSHTYIVFPVRLRGAEPAINIGEPRDYMTARSNAEQLAKFVELKLVDSSQGEAVTRLPDELDKPLRDRLREAGEAIEVLDAPTGTTVSHTVGPRDTRFEIPHSGATGRALASCIPGLIFAGFVSVVFVRPILTESNMPAQAKLIMLSFIGLFFILLPLLLSAATGARIPRLEEVIVSAKSLRVVKHGLLGVRTTEIPVHELEQLNLPGTSGGGSASARPPRRLGAGSRLPGLAAQSDKAMVEFGRGLSHAELTWIHAGILAAITDD